MTITTWIISTYLLFGIYNAFWNLFHLEQGEDWIAIVFTTVLVLLFWIVFDLITVYELILGEKS